MRQMELKLRGISKDVMNLSSHKPLGKRVFNEFGYNTISSIGQRSLSTRQRRHNSYRQIRPHPPRWMRAAAVDAIHITAAGLE